MKTILITGATDGIGLETAKRLAATGHRLLVHGRNPEKLSQALNVIQESSTSEIEHYLADFSRLEEVSVMADNIAENYSHLDVIINNAGVYKTSPLMTAAGLDVRFVVNTFAPFLLTQRLFSLLTAESRVVNLSSAAQAPVDIEAMQGKRRLGDMEAYAQSKLAITQWSQYLGEMHKASGPMLVSVNPGSLLATKMVKEGFGVAGADIGIGADILVRAALADEFAHAHGKYFDNDAERFANPHPEAMNAQKVTMVMETIQAIVN